MFSRPGVVGINIAIKQEGDCMNTIDRRRFIKLLALALVVTAGENFAWANEPGLGLIGWYRGNSCGGCVLSLLATGEAPPGVHPWLEEQPTAMDVLIVEGAVDSGDRQLQEMLKRARWILAFGTCAAYGGMAKEGGGEREWQGLIDLAPLKKLIAIPGCPPKPGWLLSTLTALQVGRNLELDDFARPLEIFGGTIHDNCPRRQYFDNSRFAQAPGEVGCYLLLGCKGPITFADCSQRLWNEGANWCVSGGGPCIGCTQPGFPQNFAPLTTRLPQVALPGIESTPETVGKLAFTAAMTGIAAHYGYSLWQKGKRGGKADD